MSLTGKAETVVEVKAPAHAIHDLFSCKVHQIPNFMPDKIQGVDLLQDQWGTVGSVVCWKYIHDGVPQTSTELIEAVDYNNYSITYKVIQGDLLKYYKSFKSELKVTPNKQGSSLRWTVEYEKLNEDVPDPTNSLLEFGNSCSIAVANHLVQPRN